MLPAVMLLIMEATYRDNRVREVGAEARTERDRNKQLQSRIDELEKQLSVERKHDMDAGTRPVVEREERVQTYDADRPYEDRERVTASRRWHLFGR